MVVPALRSSPVCRDHVIGVEFAEAGVGQDGLAFRLGQGGQMRLAREFNRIWRFHLEPFIMKQVGLYQLVVRNFKEFLK